MWPPSSMCDCWFVLLENVLARAESSFHWTRFLLLLVRCPRFTVHQQHRRTNMELDYLKLVKQRLSCVRRLNEISNVPQCEIHDGLHQVTPSTIRVRPHSSVMPNDSGRSQPQTSKSILRSKSAHPRLIQPYTPVQTNASTLQLQVMVLAFSCIFSVHVS